MPKMVLRYPDGTVGLGLLLLRLSCALSACPALAYLRHAPDAAQAATVLSAMIALALATGFGTRTAALLLGGLLVIDLFTTSGSQVHFLLISAGGAGAVVLLGAGAYSLDSRWYGRRVIRLGLRSPDRGNQH